MQPISKKDWAKANPPRENESLEQYKARYAYDTDEGVLPAVKEFAKGGALGLAKTGTSMAGGVGYLLGNRGIRDWARESEQQATEFLNPQGKAGAVGEFVGRGVGEIGSAMLGGGLALKGVTKLASVADKAGKLGKVAQATKAGLESKSAIQRALATAAVNAPVDVLQGAAQDSGMVLPGRFGAMAENVLFSGAGGYIPAALQARKAKVSSRDEAAKLVNEMMEGPKAGQKLLTAGTPGAQPYTGPSSTPQGPAIPMTGPRTGESTSPYPVVRYSQSPATPVNPAFREAGIETGQEVVALRNKLEKMSPTELAEYMAMNMPNVSEEELLQLMTQRIPIDGARVPLAAEEVKSLRGVRGQRMRPRTGAVESELLSSLAGGGIGAASGAAAGDTPEERMGYGALGGIAGLLVGSRAPRFFESGATSRAPKATPVVEKGLGTYAEQGGLKAPKMGAQLDEFPENRRPLMDRANLNETEKIMFGDSFAASVSKIEPTIARPRTRTEYDNAVRSVLKEKNVPELADLDPKRATAAEAGAMLSLVSNMRKRRTEQIELLKKAASPEEASSIVTRIDALQDTADHMLAQVMKADTEAGRSLQARRYNVQDISDPTYWYIKGSRAKDGILNEAEKSVIDKLAMEKDSTKLLQYMARLQKSSVPEQIAQLRSAGLLASFVGRTRDFVSTNANYISTVAQRYPGALADIALSKITARKLGGAADQYRTVALPSAEEAKSARDGARAGLRMAAESMGYDATKAGGMKQWIEYMRQAEIDPEMAKTLDVPALTNIDMFSRMLGENQLGKGIDTFADTYAKSVMRFSGVTDKVIKQAALMGSMQEQANLSALRRGLKGDAAKEYAAKLMRSPTDEMKLDAKMAADEITFTNDGMLSQIISNMINTGASTAGKNVAGGDALFRAAARFVVPFRRTPANILTRALEYAPVTGQFLSIKAGLDWNKELASSALEGVAKSRSVALKQRKLVDMLTKNATGLGMFALGAELYKNGVLTGEAPKGGAEMEQWRLEGKQPESILVNGQWYPVARISPYGSMMTMAASLLQKSGGKGVLEGIAQGGVGGTASAVSTSLLNQPMVTGPKEILEAAVGRSMNDEDVGDYFAKQAGSFVPSIVAQAARAEGVQRLPQTTLQNISSRIPGMQSSTPMRLNIFGEPVEKPKGVLNVMLNPLPFTPDVRSKDPLIKEMSRVGVNIGAMKKGTGEDMAMYQYRQKEAGAFVREDLESLVQSDEYQQADTASQKQMIRSTVTKARKDFSDWLKDNYNLDTDPE